MAVKELIEALERKAEARAEAILEEARERAGKVRGEAAREGKRLERELLAERAAGWEAEAARRRADARARAEREGLLARAEFLDRVFARARERLAAGEIPPGYAEGAGRAVWAALRHLGERAARVECPEALVDRIRAGLDPGDSVEVVARPDMAAGFRVVALDGSVTVDGTLAGELERRRPELAIEVLREHEGSP